MRKKKQSFTAGDEEEIRWVQTELKGKIKESKDRYRKMLKDKQQENNSKEVWCRTKQITGFRACGIQCEGHTAWDK